jgi:hypothetical protein
MHDLVEFDTEGRRKIPCLKYQVVVAELIALGISGLGSWSNAFGEIRDAFMKLNETRFEDRHRIRIRERR